MENLQTKPSLQKNLEESVILKIIIIAILILLLLIPRSFILDVIDERASRNREVEQEVRNSWSGSQKLNGPFLIVPYSYKVKIKDETYKWVTEKAVFLPDQLDVKASLRSQVLKRSIFEVAVYDTPLLISGKFKVNEHFLHAPNNGSYKWSEATLVVNISDLRGISDSPKFIWDNQKLKVGYGKEMKNIPGKGIFAQTPISDFEEGKEYHFFIEAHLKGSKELFMEPVGNINQISMASNWPHPSFSGMFLPTNRTIKEDGFNADWKVLDFNRTYPQFFEEEYQFKMGDSLGVNLNLGVDNYQKNQRSIKYCIMVILLSFIALFLIEFMTKTKIHPMQYILVGCGLSIKYLVMLSLSEHIGFNLAYLIAGILTILVLSIYFAGFLKSKKVLFTLTSFLGTFYTFVFIVIQLQDYSLLVGSLGLFIILSIIMIITRKVNWFENTSAVAITA
jgi:inner membrane protein